MAILSNNGGTNSKRPGIFKRIVILLAVLILMLGSFQAGVYFSTSNSGLKNTIDEEKLFLGNVLNKYSQTPENKLEQDIDFGLFWQVWDDLKEMYVDKEKISDKKLFYGALRGMVASLGDPYTIFMDPKISQDFQNDLAGTFEGIGAELGIKNDVLTVIAPLPDMPAEIAGLKAGDKIVAIDGTQTNGMGVDEAVNRIRGQKGTKVKLSIFREGFDKVKDFEITRDVITVKSVSTSMSDDRIMTIKISNFNDDTQELFNEAVRKTIEANPAGVILDLRNNPGGYLETAIEVASEWVEEGVVVTEKYTDDKKIEHLARGRARLKDIPTVVLVNQGSASASEIVSGALQDDDKAVLIGMKTFGKGSVQTITDLEDGSSVKITIAKWLTPKGRSINDEGIMPDIVVDVTPEDYNSNIDRQIEKAVEILKTKDFDIVKIKHVNKDTASSTEIK